MKIGYFNDSPMLDLVNFKPEKIQKPKGQSRFCPALHDSIKNMYILKSSWTMNLNGNLVNKELEIKLGGVQKRPVLHDRPRTGGSPPHPLLLSAECDPPTTSHRWPAAKLLSLLVT